MADVFDVADFFIEMGKCDENDTVTNLRINKLIYFAQAISLAEYDKALFDEEFHAWKLGPVVPCVYQKYRSYGKDNISETTDGFDMGRFSAEELDMLMFVYRYYGKFSTTELVNMSHIEGSPWKSVYKENEDNIIFKDDIKAFFSQSNPYSVPKTPKRFYKDAQPIKRDEDGILILPGSWSDDEAD